MIPVFYDRGVTIHLHHKRSLVKIFLGHVSLQTTQIYTEISQDSMNRQLKSWNDKWFLKENNPDHKSSGGAGCVPSFLM